MESSKVCPNAPGAMEKENSGLNPVALIDADIVRYRVGFACQKTLWNIYDSEDHKELKCGVSTAEKNEFAQDYENGLLDFEAYVVPEPEEVCEKTLYALVDRTRREIGAKEYQMYLTEGRTFRHDIAVTKPYKGRRKAKPHHYAFLGELLRTQYGATSRDGFEADDLISMAAWECFKQERPYVVVSNDKDLMQIPGWHFDFTKDPSVWTKVSRERATRQLYLQTLTGDTTDNIPGLPQIGPKKAQKMLNVDKDPVLVIEEAYKKHFPNNWKMRLDETFRLVRLLMIEKEADSGWYFSK